MILCGGENLMDVIERPDSGGARSFVAHAGGSPYNCCRAMGRLGAEVGYLGSFSTDRFGGELHAALVADGARHFGARTDAPTSLAMVTLDAGVPDYRFYREGTADRQVTLDGLRAAVPAGARALHLGSLALVEGPDAAAYAALWAELAGAGLVTSLDPNIRPLIADAHATPYRARLQAMAAQASVIKLSDEDAAWWFPGLAPEAALEHVAGLAPEALVILTQGPKSVLCRWSGGQIALAPPAPAPLVDTVGAGDTLMAATLAGLARKGVLSRAALAGIGADLLRGVLADAARAASITCSRAGCNPPDARTLWG
ncbi:MAG: PfkB family carbohydrate kinase [Roseinatronobacter sp.]